MRMADSLSECESTPREYKRALEKIVSVTGIPLERWRVYLDVQQISTRQAGKSSCAFFGVKFTALDQAFGAVYTLHAVLPTVNLELIIAPDGRLDMGHGLGSYDKGLGAYHRAMVTYVAQQGFSIGLLVDAQNVNRYLGLLL